MRLLLVLAALLAAVTQARATEGERKAFVIHGNRVELPIPAGYCFLDPVRDKRLWTIASVRTSKEVAHIAAFVPCGTRDATRKRPLEAADLETVGEFITFEKRQLAAPRITRDRLLVRLEVGFQHIQKCYRPMEYWKAVDASPVGPDLEALGFRATDARYMGVVRSDEYGVYAGVLTLINLASRPTKFADIIAVTLLNDRIVAFGIRTTLRSDKDFTNHLREVSTLGTALVWANKRKQRPASLVVE